MASSSLYYSPVDLKGSRVLITGATSGIGEATAYRLAEIGCKLHLLGRRSERLAELKQKLERQFPTTTVYCHVLDLMDLEAVKNLHNEIDEPLDILINNAGMGIMNADVWETDHAKISDIFTVNTIAPMALIRTFLPRMLRAGHGHIVNPIPGASAYSGTKYALNGYSLAARMDLVDTPIRLTCISPGLVKTELLETAMRSKEASDKVYTANSHLNPADIADNIVYAITRPSHVQIADIQVFPTNLYQIPMALPQTSLYPCVDVRGSRVLITGATAGIGEATARRFAEIGCDLYLVGRREDRLKSLKAELEKHSGTTVHPIMFDLKDVDKMEQIVGGPLDILVNNAGYAVGRPAAWEADVDDIQNMFNVNVIGYMALIRLFLPDMLRQGRGHIVNVSSISAFEPCDHSSVYTATKYALNGYAMAARMDVVDTPIRITNISPGMVHTEFQRARFNHSPDMFSAADSVYDNIVYLNPEDIADQIVYAVTRPPHVQIADIISYSTNQARDKYVEARVGADLGKAECLRKFSNLD
ncbi:hypothetical protein FOZ62_021592 [Perkinsus olseni]|uniref:Uncharacterized protein n=1 Tax=Perkinsus olseni TaxID=32597 RepID=A0A7J6TI17_PEROL|nr:hypothetical protein FOZ62_021592 [Perkinsus olseni]